MKDNLDNDDGHYKHLGEFRDEEPGSELVDMGTVMTDLGK